MAGDAVRKKRAYCGRSRGVQYAVRRFGDCYWLRGTLPSVHTETESTRTTSVQFVDRKKECITDDRVQSTISLHLGKGQVCLIERSIDRLQIDNAAMKGCAMFLTIA